jgi:hypothetical protein
VVEATPQMKRESAMERQRERAKRKPGIPGDRFQVELRGTAQYYVIDSQTHMTMGGPFRDRTTAQQRADALQRNLGWR